MERRRALTWLVHAGSAAAATMVGLPTLSYVIAPGNRSAAEPLWATLGPVSIFAPGTVRAARGRLLSQQAVSSPLLPVVYVWRVDEQDLVVFSRSCTDLGCPITFDPGSECFFCPCHGGIFSKQGEPMAGPPDRPLYRYQTRIEKELLQIDLNSVPPVA